MLADLDYLVEMPDGSTAILECKTTNYNARDKWEYDGKPIVPPYYESQGRHYMAVMNLNRVYFCCLYGNNEDETIIRCIERDMDYESELIFLEEEFWTSHVQARKPPSYTEHNGDLILQSLRRLLGPSVKDAPPVLLTPPQSANIFRFLELKEQKSRLDTERKFLEAEMQRTKALIVADMGNSCKAVYEDASGSYTVTFSPSYQEKIPKDSLLRLKAVYPDIYAEYVSLSESRRFHVKKTKLKTA